MALTRKPKNEPVQRERAIDEFIEAAGKQDVVEKPSGTIARVVYWEPALFEKLEAARKKRGMVSRSAYVQMLVARALEQGEG